MKQKILAIGDLQFHSYKQCSQLVDGVNSRLLDIIGAWNQAVDIAQKEGCKAIWIPGDIFEIRGNIRPSVFNRITELIVEAVGNGLDIVAIPGNHDMEHFDAGDSAIDSWRHIQSPSHSTGCSVFRKPDVTVSQGWRIAGIPYCHSIHKFKEAFMETAKLDPDAILIHQGVDDFNPGGTCPATGLTASWLAENSPQDCWVLCGHYHNPGRMGRVINVGAPVQHRFSDEGCERGCWIVEENDARFIPLVSPKFLTLEAGAVGSPDLGGNFVKVRGKSLKEAEKLRKLAESSGASAVLVEIEKEFKSAHERTVSLAGPREMLKDYLGITCESPGHAQAVLELFDRICG